MAEYIIISSVAGALILVGMYFIVKKALKEKSGDVQSLALLQNQINETNRILDHKLTESNRAFQHQFSETAKIVKDVTERLTKLDDTNKQVINFTEQLKNLQDILKNPKQRGILGEYYLEVMLKNVLPPNAYEMQYKFKDGSIVDAVIFIKDNIVPIDSKFSLENYNRLVNANDPEERKKLENALRDDIKNRIDETSKYVKPKENTLNFAFMFIPSEAVFYDILINKVGSLNARDLVEYAAEKRVTIVSPTSFMAYLQTLVQGLRALQIEESAKEIKKRVEDLSKHLIVYETYLKKIGDNLGTTVRTYNSAYKEFGKIDKDIYKITGASIESEPVLLEKPIDEDAE